MPSLRTFGSAASKDNLGDNASAPPSSEYAHVGSRGASVMPSTLAPPSSAKGMFWAGLGRSASFGKAKLRLSLFALMLAAVTNGYDGSLINGLLSISAFNRNLGPISSTYSGLIIASISLGGTPTFLPAAYLSDRLGRKPVAILGAATMAVASLVQASTRGPAAFLVTRVFLGVGLAFTQTSSPPLLNELARPENRAVVGAAYNASYYLGAITSAWVTFATLSTIDTSDWAWRIPCLVQAVAPLAQLLLLLVVVPESPRWLVAKGHHDEAYATLLQLHARPRAARFAWREQGHEEKQEGGTRREQAEPNGNEAPSCTGDEAAVRREFDEIEAATRAELEARLATGWLSFFATGANRRRLFIVVIIGVMVQWSGNGIISYYLSPVLLTLGINDARQRSAINGGLQIWNALFAALGAALTERLGRRFLWLTSVVGMLLCEVAVTICSATFDRLRSGAWGVAAVVFLFLFFGAYDVAMTPLNFLYVVEVLPFAMRARGLALNQCVVFGAGFFNQFVNPLALASLAWRYYLVYIALLVVFTVIIWFTFPETKGLTLEQVETVFEKPTTPRGTARPTGTGGAISAECPPPASRSGHVTPPARGGGAMMGWEG